MSAGRIRKIEDRDIQAVTNLWNESILSGESTYEPTSLSATQVRDTLVDIGPPFETYVFDTDEGVVGWCGLLQHYSRSALNQSAELSACVVRNSRRHGIGRSLAKHAIARAPKLGIHTILLLLRREPTYLLTWALREGFRHIGQLSSVLQIGDRFHDIVVFQLTMPERYDSDKAD